MKKIIINTFTGLTLLLLSCNKQDFLNEKPSSGIVVPNTIRDFQALLDNTNFLNQTPALPTISADEYFISDIEEYNSLLTKTEKNSCIWAVDIFGGEVNRLDWNTPYKSIFYANEVITGYSHLPVSEQMSPTGKDVMAQAYFVRAWNLYTLAQTFAKTYQSQNYNSPGLPLKLSPNIDEVEQRSTVQQTYTQIFSDLVASCALFSNNFPSNNRNRGSKAAAYALLSRIYLNAHNYEKANLYADSALLIHNALIDYNTISTSSSSPFPTDNSEIIIRTTQVFDYSITGVGAVATAKIDTNIIKSYSENDLRKKIFFSYSKIGNNEYYTLKRGYNGKTTFYPFSGLAVDELYLIKAECLTRQGQLNDGASFINKLLLNRYTQGTFSEISTNNKDSLLSLILMERRKELIWRGIRWSDVKRLNEEGANITLTRTIGGTIYNLAPNSTKYVMPIPQDEINLSKIIQNDRSN